MQLLQSESTLPIDPFPSILEDAIHDLAFAGRAALYLDKQGLDHRSVVQCLIDEFELDRETAEAVASMAA